MTQMTNKLIFTDLDGTLLDHDTYSWAAAKPALQYAAEHGIPVIPCTSKTFPECRETVADLKLNSPFIFENGAGIALPTTLFSKPYPHHCEQEDGYWICSLGTPYSDIRNALLSLRNSKHYQFRAFGDMTVNNIMEVTGLDNDHAQRAKMRRFSEPMLWLDNAKSFDMFSSDINKLGLTLTRGGRFIHVAGETDKGKGTLWLARRYASMLGSAPQIIALGDSANDLPMLSVADTAVIIRPLHTNPIKLAQQKPVQKIITTDLIGPAGWNQAVLSILAQKETVRG